MQRRISVVLIVMALAAVVSQATSVYAGSLGTLGFSELGTPTANTGDILTATNFTITNWTSTSGSGTGVFAGLSPTTIGAITFNNAAGVNTSFAFTNAVIGDFTSTSIAEITSSSTTGAVANFFIAGNYTGGSLDPSVHTDGLITLSFTQTPPHSGGLSDSGTLAVGNPEPSTLVMGLTSAVAIGVVYGVRRLRKAVA